MKLSAHSDVPVKYLKSDLDKGDYYSTSKYFKDVYSEYKVHKDACSFFLQWLITMKEVAVTYRDPDPKKNEKWPVPTNFTYEITDRINKDRAMEIFKMATYEMIWVLEHSYFRVMPCMLLDKDDWRAKIDRIGDTEWNSLEVYVEHDYGEAGKIVYKRPGRELIKIEEWTYEEPKVQIKAKENHYPDNYEIPEDADKDINWLNKIRSDSDK